MRSGDNSMAIPSASRTSAEPHFELTERLPCLATRTPAPATTNAAAVEILKVPMQSPPVPQVSTRTGSEAALPVRIAGKIGIGVGAHYGGEADEFFHRLAFFAKRGEKADNFGFGGTAGQDLLHRGFGFGAREMMAFDNLLCRGGNHRIVISSTMDQEVFVKSAYCALSFVAAWPSGVAHAACIEGKSSK